MNDSDSDNASLELTSETIFGTARPEVEIHVIDEEELLSRYCLQPQPPCDDDIIICRPDIDDIVARYSSKAEAAEDLIVVSHPNDDDIVKRYAVPFYPKQEFLPASPEQSDNVDELGYDEAEMNMIVGINNGLLHCSESATPGQDSGSNDSGYSESRLHLRGNSNMKAKIENDTSEPSDPFTCICDSDLTDDDAMGTDDSDELDLEAKCVNGDAGCSSRHNHNITVYNLCCDKSALPIDASDREFLTSRSLLLYNPTIPGDSRGKATKSKKTKGSRLLKKRFLQVIKAFETAAHDIDCQCISAKKSLRKNDSPANVSRTANLFVDSLSPVINQEHSLLRKMKTYLTRS